MAKTDSLYMTIYNYLKENIDNNCYSNGKRLPTEMELAQQFYVSRITPKKALNTLADEGIVVRIPGKGSFTKEGYQNNGGTINSEPKKTIALVMGGYASSFGLDILNGVMDTAENLSLNMILKATYNSQETEAQIISSLMNAGVSGIIVQPSQGELYSETLLKAVYSGYPIVMIDRNMQGINVPFVGVDNVVLAKNAVEEIVRNGHKNVALIAFADENSSTINERMQGYSDAFMDSGLVVNKDLFLTNINQKLHEAGLTSESDGAYEFFVKEIKAFIECHPEITAIFGTEYAAAKASFDAVRQLGGKIPDDISIVSFDIDSSYIGSHKMSYIKQPQRQMGIRACEILHNVINHKSIEELKCLLNGEWVDGFSIKRL